jgi:hypothetical protein
MPEDADTVTGATMSLSGQAGRWVKFESFNPTRNAMVAFREAVISNSTPAASVENGLATARTVQLSLDAMDKGSVETY